MPISKGLREFIELLNSNGVKENARSIPGTLKAFGFGGLAISAAGLVIPKRVVQLGVPPNRIDLITTISGVTFEQAWAHRVFGDIDGLSVQFIGLEDLIQKKESTCRGKT